MLCPTQGPLLLTGAGGQPWVITTDGVMGVLRALACCKGPAPGPDALTYELLALLGEGAAEVMANVLQYWCRDMGDTPMPKSWKESLAALLHKGRGVGFASLRSLGIVSVIQRVAAKTTLNAMGDSIRPPRVNVYAHRRRGRVDLATMPLRLVLEKRR